MSRPGSGSVRGPRAWRLPVVGALSAVLLATFAFAAPVSAAVHVSAGCTAGVGDVPALAHAIKRANNRSRSSLTVITLGSHCVYTLTKVRGYASFGNSGLPVIRRHVVFEGRSATLTRSSQRRFRIMAVGPAGNVTLNDLSITNGRAANGKAGADAVNASGGDGAPGRDGGGIYNKGRLTLNNVIVSGNSAGDGGRGGSSTTSNAAAGADNPSGTGDDGQPAATAQAGDGGAGGDGGGIFNKGKLVIASSDISGNTAGDGGRGGSATGGNGGRGGLGVIGGRGGDGGDALAGHGGDGGNGGGILNRGTLYVDSSTINGNSAGDGADSGDAYGGKGGDAGGDHADGGTGGDIDVTSGGGGTGGTLAALAGSAVLQSTSADSNAGGQRGSLGHFAMGDAGVPGCDGVGYYGTGTDGFGGSGIGGIASDGGTVTLVDVTVTNSIDPILGPIGPIGPHGPLIGPPCSS